MWYRPYGRTGKEISVVSFGGMQFSKPEDIDANAELVVYAHERGINYFDTAPYYCDDKSEDIIGAAVKQMQPGTFHLSTKCSEADGGKLRASLEKSLKRLNAERIGFFHIWGLLSVEAWRKRVEGGAVAAALRAKDEGLIEHLAFSGHMSGPETRQVLTEGPFEGVTLGYSAINFPYRADGVAAAGEMNKGVITMNPLGGGLICKHADRFDFIRGPNDPSVVAAALRFNVSNPNVTAALVGFTTKQHVDEAVAAVEDFAPYAPERIEEIRNHILAGFANLCTGCRYCLPCEEDVPIPKLMDAYNMRILAGDEPSHVVDRLKWHWGLKPEAAAACNECGACEDKCTQHLPIRQRLKEVAALAEKRQP